MKSSIEDADGTVIVDGTDTQSKRVLWSTIKSTLGQIFTPLTRKINDKELSTDVTLTGDDIKTSASDNTTISSSLSNLTGTHQLNSYLSLAQIGIQAESTSIADVCVALPTNSEIIWGYSTASIPTITDAPFDFCTFRIVKRGNSRCYCVAIERENKGVQTATWTSSLNPSFFGWKPFALATPPQEYDLPLADGVSDGGGNVSRYWKNQFGEVGICVYVNATSLSGGVKTIATLPTGFRPTKDVVYPCGTMTGSTRQVGSLNIAPDGTMQYYGDTSASQYLIYAAGSFVAAS